MFVTLKTKIWLTVITVVLLFTFFTLFYFPARQREVLLSNYNNEVQNLANTVSLGVRIALDEQNYEGVKTAMEFVKGSPGFKYVSLLQTDTVWNAAHNQFTLQETIFQTVGDTALMHRDSSLQTAIIRKRSPFATSLLAGAIVVAFSTEVINKSEAEVQRTSLIVSGSIFLIGMLIGLWLSRRISVPVVALRNAAQRVSAGDFTTVVERASNDEIGDLAMAFNKMVQDLSTARTKLNTTNQELSQTNSALQQTLTDLKATQAQLVQSERLASLGELTAGIAHEIQNPLNFVNNFSELNVELLQELRDETDNGNKEEALLIAGYLTENNEKINLHGKRADGIVKSMLQHARKSTGEKEVTDINLLIDEYLRLSYHGLRAKDKTFQANFHTHFDAAAGTVKVVPQDMGRVLLNLFNNAFYAVNQKAKTGRSGYEPAVNVTTERRGSNIEIRVTDNGLGISKSLLDKIFQPFFTTKPTGQGTGLGLSLSYDIVKAHGGQLAVDSKEGEYTTFIIQLPATAKPNCF